MKKKEKIERMIKQKQKNKKTKNKKNNYDA